MSQPANTLIRPARPDDQRYVAATWFHSMCGRTRPPRKRTRINAQIDHVLDDPTTRCLVAERGDRIIGWLVYAAAPVGRVVHYAYVRDEERARGLCRRLLAAAWPGSQARLVLTLRGPMTDRFIAAHAGKAIFCPLEEVIR